MFGARIVYDAMLVGQRNIRLDIGGAGAAYLRANTSECGTGVWCIILAFGLNDLEGLIAHMQANGVVFRKGIVEDTSFRYAMCEAPDGVLLELYEVKPGGEWMVGEGG